MSPAVCIVNPRSGGGRTGERWPAIAARLEALGLAHEVRFTTRPGEGEALAAAALREGADLVVAVGGDGTVHEVASGFFDGEAPFRPDARLGVIPAGSGSDFVKTLGLPADPLAAAARLVEGAPKAIDATRVVFRGADGREARRWSVNIASLGMPAAVLEKMAGLPGWVHGQARYALGSVLAIVDLRPFAIDWRVDGVAQPPKRALFVAVGNACYFGAGMHVMPHAVQDDGWLDAVVIEERPVWEVLNGFPRLYNGTHLELPMASTVRGRRIEIDADAPVEIDGEIAGRGPATFEVAPGALRVMV